MEVVWQMSDDESGEVTSANSQHQSHRVADASRAEVERTPLLPRGQIRIISV